MPLPGKTKPTPFASIYESLRIDLSDPVAGIDRTESVVRMLILTAMQQFRLHHDRQPVRLFIPLAVEAALEVDRARNLGQPTATHGKIRSCPHVFGCTPVWDAAEFRCE